MYYDNILFSIKHNSVCLIYSHFYIHVNVNVLKKEGIYYFYKTDTILKIFTEIYSYNFISSF